MSFVSKGWGGRVSDVFLTENCGFLQKLLPGDLVLADRGFTVQDSQGCTVLRLRFQPLKDNLVVMKWIPHVS